MMTPQEVASRAFSKAALGGYNMAMVDEFLDALTEDYTTLYNDNAILKNKLKVLSDTVEEYRATDGAMRKTLLAAQQMADAIVSEAEKKKQSLVQDAEAAAQQRLEELRRQYAEEEFRLKSAQEATTAYVQQARQFHEDALQWLDSVRELTMDNPQPAQPVPPRTPPQIDIPAPAEPAHAPASVAAAPAAAAPDLDATRRFEDLQFGKDYPIT